MRERHEAHSLAYVRGRIRQPLEDRYEPVGLTPVVGTHGTQVDSIVRLARDGVFSGGAASVLQETFYITPNLRNRDWQLTDFACAINSISRRVNPIEVSKEYATTDSLARFIDHEMEDFEPVYGMVVTFSRRVLELVESVDVDDLDEPEAALRQAPPLESVRAIYPVDQLAADALGQALDRLD